jgi:hypothetical protein
LPWEKVKPLLTRELGCLLLMVSGAYWSCQKKSLYYFACFSVTGVKGRGDVYLLDGERDGGPLVSAFLSSFGDKSPDGVLYAERLAVVLLAGLEGDGGRGVGREGEGEGEGVRAKLLNEFLLDRSQLAFFLVRWHDLFFGQDKFFAELKAHDLIFFATISVGGGYLKKDDEFVTRIV